MYTFLKNVSPRKLAVNEVPAFGTALLLAESLYKLGSFVLECLAFIVTWYILSFIFDKLIMLGNRKFLQSRRH